MIVHYNETVVDLDNTGPFLFFILQAKFPTLRDKTFLLQPRIITD